MKYLIDVNLPYYFSLWNTHQFVHMHDINDEWSDSEIWNYAKEHNLSIITKDSDFSNKILFAQPPPKVIHIRFGNLKMNSFFEVMQKLWPEVEKLNEENKLINVFSDRIEAIK